MPKRQPENFSLRDVILEEHSKRQTMRVVNWVGNDAKRFGELMRLFFADEYRVTQRAAGAVSYCVQAHPELIKPYLKKIILNLSKPGHHDAVLRNTVRLLQDIPVPKQLQGELANACFTLLLRPESAVAVKAFSMTVLYNLAKEEPDLRHEIRIVIEGLLPYGTPAIRNRGTKIIRALGKL